MTDWDVEKYRLEHECEEHWELRKRFLETHKDDFPEEKLVCLAQVFYNVEFLGCRYPEKTMLLVAQLSKGIADDHREKAKSKLQRTFVQASDAASSKVKGKVNNNSAAQNKRRMINFQKETGEDDVDTKRIKMKEMPQSVTVIANPETQNDSNFLQGEPPTNNIPGRYVLAYQPSQKTQELSKTSQPKEAVKSIAHEKLKLQDSSLSNIILLESKGMSALSILSRSFQNVHKKMTTETEIQGNLTECTIFVNDDVLAKAVGDTAKVAKCKCATEALSRLQKICYTLVIKDNLAGSTVDKNEAQHSGIKSVPEPEPEHLSEGGKASRMMKLMGWTGKGLGKNEHGRTEPVKAVSVVRRAGLGTVQQEGQFRGIILDMIKKFKFSNPTADLVFAADFSKEERAIIHQVAKKFRIKSVSYGKDENRRLVLHRNISYHQILEEVISAGGSTEKYDAIPPRDN